MRGAVPVALAEDEEAPGSALPLALDELYELALASALWKALAGVTPLEL